MSKLMIANRLDLDAWGKAPYNHLGIKEKPEKSWKGKAFFASRNIDSWLERLESDKNLRLKGLPYILQVWIIKGIITQSEYVNLANMLSSPDRENWVLALSIMKIKAKQKRK